MPFANPLLSCRSVRQSKPVPGRVSKARFRQPNAPVQQVEENEDQLLAARVDGQIQALQCAGAQQEQVSLISEDDFVDCEGLLYAHDGKTNAPGNALAVCHHEFGVFFFASDTNFFKHCSGHPGVFAAGIDEDTSDADST